MAGGGYTSELLARAVGPEGRRLRAEQQDSSSIASPRSRWSERLAKPVMKNVVRVDRELDNPLPPEAKNLDAFHGALLPRHGMAGRSTATR